MEYEVLYYKRTNKVHKSRGVSKADGILTLHENGNVQLKSTKEEDNDDNRQNSNSIFSGRKPELAKRLLQDDEVVVLGNYEAQIVACRGNAAAASALQPSTQLTTQPSLKKVQSIKPRALVPKVLPVKRTLAGKVLVAKEHVDRDGDVLDDKTDLAATETVATLKPPPLATLKPPPLASLSRNVVRRRPLHPKVASQPASQNKSNPPHRSIVGPVHMPSQLTLSSQTSGILPHIPLPATLAEVLKPHQVTGVDFLWKALVLDNKHSGAILADEMGLGKSLQTISIIAAMHRQRREKPFMVVCPSSLVNNWSKEFDKWIGKAGQPRRVVIYKGGQDGLAKVRAYITSLKSSRSNQNGQVLIISYELLRMNANLFSEAGQSFGLLVVDEGHRLKNTSGTQTLTALESLLTDARLCLTATPIQNNLSEFYTLANFVRPGVLGDLASFRRDFERLLAASSQKDATAKQRSLGAIQSKELESVTRTFMLRRLQKHILKSMLPSRTEVLLFCRPSQRQCELYSGVAQRAKGLVANGMAEALTALVSLRKICCHPTMYTGDEDESVDAMDLERLESLEQSGKLVVLTALLRSIRASSPDDKIVIVSNFTSVLAIIETLILQPNHYAYSRLDGTTDVQNRQALVDNFNRCKPENNFCFLLSAKAGGCGLNLIGANRLCLMDPDFNPATDIQAMGRIFRQGQVKPTFMYRLFTSGTVEEVIYQRQLQKGNLATMAVGNGGVGASTKFTKEELTDCFTLKVGCKCDTKRKLGKQWCTFEGDDNPEATGLMDSVLAAVSKEASETLGYVHIVNDEEACTSVPGSSVEASPSNTGSTEHSEDEKEFRFPGSSAKKARTAPGPFDDSDDDDEFEF